MKNLQRYNFTTNKSTDDILSSADFRDEGNLDCTFCDVSLNAGYCHYTEQDE